LALRSLEARALCGKRRNKKPGAVSRPGIPIAARSVEQKTDPGRPEIGDTLRDFQFPK
jgi:hypothetical protein